MKVLFTALFINLFLSLTAQGILYPLDNDLYHRLDRLMVKYENPNNIHFGLKYYQREDIYKMAASLYREDGLSEDDKDDAEYFISENRFFINESMDTAFAEIGKNDKGLFNWFFKSRAAFWELNGKDYFLRLNPKLSLSYGSNLSGQNETLFRNSRGLELYGGLTDKIYFYTNIIETQERFPDYVNDFILERKAIPGNGFYKSYSSDIFGIKNGFDYLNSVGYLGFNIAKYLGMQLGHGSHFIGNGHRSLILSDFSNNYFYLKLNWRFWKIHYQNLWMELRPQSSKESAADQLLGRKYAAIHHLSLNIAPTINIGLFEAVYFHRSDQLELGYLNPLILYRTVEQSSGSPDNVLIGMDARVDLFKRWSLYAQLVFDEFKLNELITDNNGWWANKYSAQIGVKAYDLFGINMLDAQAEFNFVRPYTYTHRDSSASVSHYNLALAHPMGANLKEYIFTLKYRLWNKLFVKGQAIIGEQGLDPEGENWGSNILLPHTSRVMDYGNETGQGIKNKYTWLGLDLSCMLYHNLFLDLRVLNRSSSRINADDTFLSFGLRLNMAKTNYDF